jgi:hypothetical protein
MLSGMTGSEISLKHAVELLSEIDRTKNNVSGKEIKVEK